jgi:hypothetical protein
VKGKSPQTHIFATKRDIEPGVQRVEATIPLQYALSDLYEASSPRVYASLLLTEDLGISRTGAAIRSPTYLAIRVGESIHLEAAPQRKGGVRYSLTQAGNPRSIAIRLGGIFEDSCVVAGTVGRVSDHPDSLALYDAYVKELTKGFRKIRFSRVGPDAARLLQEGKRLVTMGIDEPPEYDLKG